MTLPNNMRWIIRTIQFCLCGFVFLGTTLSYASVTLKISASNPSSFEARKIPLKSYLPKGIRPEDVINAGDLAVSYDDELQQCYVHTEMTLEAKASVIYEVEIEDIWLVEQAELDELDNKTDALVSDLRDTQYSEFALQIQKNVQKNITDILSRQEDALIFKVGPSKHLTAHEINREAIVVIQGSINDLERLLSVVNEDRKTGKEFDQTRAARLMQAQQIKKQILNFDDPDMESSCLVEETLKAEREDIVLESPETVLMKIEFENPSTTKPQVAP